MKTSFAFLAAAALLVACSETSTPPTSLSVAKAKRAADVELIAGWNGGDFGTADVKAAAATTFRGFICGVPTTNFVPIIATTDSHATVSNSGNAELYCKAQLPASIPAPSGGAVVFDGFLCGTFGGVTTDSHAVVTPSGNVILQCHFKANG